MGTSLVHWDGGEYTNSCGYCHRRGFVATGLTATFLTAHDYQNLVDRGWRRCGNYLYKPTNEKMCCPMYTIRCDAVNLQLSKSQKKVLRRFNAFLMNKDSQPPSETSPRKTTAHNENASHLVEEKSRPCQPYHDGGISEVILPQTTPRPISKKEKKYIQKLSTQPIADSKPQGMKEDELSEKKELANNGEINKEEPCSSIVDEGHKREAESPKPMCKKAKVIRLERRKAKMEKKGILVEDEGTKRENKEKILEDYIQEVTPRNSVRKLEITLIRSVSNEETHMECFALYAKYQEAIHNDHGKTFQGYKRFLMDSPLNEIPHGTDSDSPACGYGTFHQLYRIDGKLIAVGVLDILPKCVSSVYFFYDPDFMHLNLGTYGALRELEFTRKLAQRSPSINQYYLGYYIHSCQKMRYKGQWRPSYLLCPEAYTWHPITECIGKLDVSPYSRLNGDANAKSEEDDVDVGSVKLYLDSSLPPIRVRDCATIDDKWKSNVAEFARLVGRSGVRNILLRCPPWSFGYMPDDDDDDDYDDDSD